MLSNIIPITFGSNFGLLFIIIDEYRPRLSQADGLDVFGDIRLGASAPSCVLRRLTASGAFSIGRKHVGTVYSIFMA